MTHWEVYVVDAEDVWWGAVLGAGSAEEALLEARRKVDERMVMEPKYRPVEFVVFRCVSIARVPVA